MNDQEQALEAFKKIVEILEPLPDETRERVVRAAMILVGSPLFTSTAEPT